jgi:hypothetical protein
MPSTLIPACTLCGLRFSNRALLDLHIREDHLERDAHTKPGHGDSADAGTSRVRAGGPAMDNGLAPSRPHTTEEVITMTATQQPRSGRVMAALHRAAGRLRYVNDQLVRAMESVIRSARASRPGPRPGAPEDAADASATKHAGRAA